MRAWEFIREEITPSKPVTIRALHNIKHEERRREKAEAERRALWPIIYGRDDARDIELAKRELDQDRREIALDKREAELDLLDQQLKQSEEYHDAVRKMAKSDITRQKQ